MKKYLNLTVLTLMISCSTIKSTEVSNTNKEMKSNHVELTGQIVYKEFINKGGKNLGFKEMYLRCSIQDYFIKFCESTVSQKEIEDLKLSEFDGIKVKADILEGEWDSCDSEIPVQSRIGKYVVIYKIL